MFIPAVPIPTVAPALRRGHCGVMSLFPRGRPCSVVFARIQPP
ncbi:hypothetical protein BOO71_0001369 [Deinococcus marmoris]|uniref:Uncharacterized protein n=1 Tax=Deinococcus marmoris TaxID=249408 RepID=A0A1U7P3Z1_9DEIO|nr:hypothetical protein BOO71_0001369 [Deinococcus marmoris]